MTDETFIIDVQFNVDPGIAELTKAMFQAIIEFYRKGEPGRERVLMVMDALAICSAIVISGGGQEAYELFANTVHDRIKAILASAPEDFAKETMQ